MLRSLYKRFFRPAVQPLRLEPKAPPVRAIPRTIPFRSLGRTATVSREAPLTRLRPDDDLPVHLLPYR
jgi:hypothetical protein